MSFSNYTARAILNALFGKTSDFGALASRPTIHVAVSSTEPTETGTNVTEPSTGDYARVETAPEDWNAATDADPSVVTNAAGIEFPPASADWLAGANIGWAVAFDAATDGEYLGKAQFAVAKPVLDGDTLEFEPGDLAFSLD